MVRDGEYNGKVASACNVANTFGTRLTASALSYRLRNPLSGTT